MSPAEHQAYLDSLTPAERAERHATRARAYDACAAQAKNTMNRVEIARRAAGWGVDPDTAQGFLCKRRAAWWAGVAIFLLVGFALGSLCIALGERMAAVASQEDLRQAFRNGVAVGAICARQPDLEACRPEELESGGVL